MNIKDGSTSGRTTVLDKLKFKRQKYLFLLFVLIGWAFVLYKTIDLSDYFYKRNIKMTVYQATAGPVQDVFEKGTGSLMGVLYIDDVDFPFTNKVFMHAHIGDVSRLGLKENFFIKLESNMNVIKGGEYEFIVGSDDGFVLYIDDKEAMSFKQRRDLAENRVKVALNKGVHKINLIYFQATGGMGLTAKYKPVEKKSKWHVLGNDSCYIKF